LATAVCAGLNKAFHTDNHEQFPNSPARAVPDIAYVIPLDGYHLTRKQLSEMPNAEEAVFRRGAAFTFDPQSYLSFVENIRQRITPETTTLYAPSFDHAVKDPVENDISIPPTARIVIFEGLYTALDESGWREAHALMDETWFIETPVPVATARVAKRNYAAGISSSLEESLSRTEKSDMRNAREVIQKRLPVQEIVPSVEDESWKSEAVDNIEKNLKALEDEGHDVRMERMSRMDSIAMLAADGVGM
jgi:pantothenate kinase